ncbi:MAG: TetR/AcrR family transcriptional regulator, partial [Pseudoflavonifractor sp.]
MKEQKDDQRTRMTRRLLQQALVELMREKPLRSVTVKELCARAEVNRSTFYLHYYDIYALMQELDMPKFRKFGGNT